MSLIDFIEKLQKKPKYVRNQILWLCVSFCMIFVVGIWFVTFKKSISNQAVETEEKTISIKESLKANVKSLFESVQVEESAQGGEKIIEYKQEIIKPNNLPIRNER